MTPNRIMAKNGWITPYPACPRIQLIVPTASFAASMKATGVGDDPVWVERMKEGWETDMLALLDALFNSTWTPKVIFSEIKARCEEKDFKVHLFPRVYRVDRIPTQGRSESDVLAEVINLYMNAVTSGPVSQGGDNAIIHFDPATWKAGNIMRLEAETTNPGRFGGAGMEARDNLFHELVHAQRRLKGIRDRTPTQTAAYSCVEEFAAVLITNIAISEHNPARILRYCETTFMPMPAVWNTSKGYLANAENVDLIKRIAVQDPTLFSLIANSPGPNPFNPIRRLRRGALWKAAMADW